MYRIIMAIDLRAFEQKIHSPARMYRNPAVRGLLFVPSGVWSYTQDGQVGQVRKWDGLHTRHLHESTQTHTQTQTNAQRGPIIYRQAGCFLICSDGEPLPFFRAPYTEVRTL